MPSTLSFARVDWSGGATSIQLCGSRGGRCDPKKMAHCCARHARAQTCAAHSTAIADGRLNSSVGNATWSSTIRLWALSLSNCPTPCGRLGKSMALAPPRSIDSVKESSRSFAVTHRPRPNSMDFVRHERRRSSAAKIPVFFGFFPTKHGRKVLRNEPLTAAVDLSPPAIG